VNNVHLVCRNLHQIANLHVNPKLRFDQNSPKNPESLVRSSRIFEELEFFLSGFLSEEEGFPLLEEYLGFTGPHIKTVIISISKVDLQILQKFLDMLPNLRSLELFRAFRSLEMLMGMHANTNNDPKLDLKSTKIERIKMVECIGYDNLLESLEKCAIKEATLDADQVKPETMQKFLKSQENNMKKLTIKANRNLPVYPKDLRLEYLDFEYSGDQEISIEFLKTQVDFKYLRLAVLNCSDQNLKLVFGMKNLEGLRLDGSVIDSSGLDQLHKLEKLKGLEVTSRISANILDHLRFGVFKDLEELDAYFEGASLESVQEMSQITPNLKKLVIHKASSDTVNIFLDTLENLESLNLLDCRDLEIPEKAHPKIKHLDHSCRFDSKCNAKQFTQQFPNLEYLKLYSFTDVTESSFITLLRGLKRLKSLHMQIWRTSAIDSEAVLQCFRKYGDHLEDANIYFRFPGLKTVPKFVIEKRPKGSFGVTMKNK
jgi:hypothetical protein